MGVNEGQVGPGDGVDGVGEGGDEGVNMDGGWDVEGACSLGSG